MALPTPFFPPQECDNTADCMNKLRDGYVADAEKHLRKRFLLPPLELCNASPNYTSDKVLLIASQVFIR